jgi:hypothetical protein
MKMKDLNFNDPSLFILARPKVLDEVLTMGFPQLSGLEATQIVERSQVNTFISHKSSRGEVVSNAENYFEGLIYIVIMQE